MIRCRYAQQLSPPAPFVKVTLQCPTTGTRAADLPAQLDTPLKHLRFKPNDALLAYLEQL